MKEKFLPIGSVVKVKENDKQLMITGYLPVREKDGKKEVYDYLGCVYPLGVVKTDINAVFNRADIEKILYIGHVDDDCKKLIETLQEGVELAKNQVIQEEKNKDNIIQDDNEEVL